MRKKGVSHSPSQLMPHQAFAKATAKYVVPRIKSTKLSGMGVVGEKIIMPWQRAYTAK